MGAVYAVACKKCKVTRGLGKLYGLDEVKDRSEAVGFSEYLKGRPNLFKEGLLLSFMFEHIGHECVFFVENSKHEDELNPNLNDEYRDDFDFWM